MSRRARVVWLALLGLLVALVGLAAFVLSLPAFGGNVVGARLERARTNPQFRDGVFVNVEPVAPTSVLSLGSYLVRQFSGDEVRVPPKPVPVLRVDPVALARPPAPGLRAFWIGHASVYVEIDGLRVLIDPVFSTHASPLEFGPERFHAPPVALADLPPIDAVVISHDHYDHLDMKTVQHLAARGTRFYVPLGIGAHLERWSVPAAQVEELEWWQERTLRGVRFVCTPTRHYSGRGLNNANATLWSSWSVIGASQRFYYSGDTGYSRHFGEIGTRLGPFDLGFVKIGAYGPGQPWIDIHMPPEEAVRAAREVGAKRLFPVHWSTFNLAYHDWDEPIRRTLAAARATGLEVVTPRIGEIVDAARPFDSTAWWEAVR
jgi:L-ascorbate metabolism protein UlaG (beta-lactamase superfamily)